MKSITEGNEKRKTIHNERPITERPTSNKKDNEAIDIIQSLLNEGFTYASECGGDIHCFYCGEYQFGKKEQHEKDCPWIRAKEFITNHLS